MKKLFLFFLIPLTLSQAQTTRTCSEAPQGVMPFNSDWYYSEFQIPENFQIVSLYGGFERPGYIPAHYDYIAQFYTAGQSITSLGDYQLFNYDMIDEPLYNREFNIENLNVMGAGTLRLSVPVTHGVIWNEACVTLSETDEHEAVPEPSILALFAMGILALGFAHKLRRKS
jgi:hypothetical protein